MQILKLAERAKALGPAEIDGTKCHLTDTLRVSQSRLTVEVKAKPAGSDKWATYQAEIWATFENGPNFDVSLADEGKVNIYLAQDALLDVEAYIGGMLKAS